MFQSPDEENPLADARIGSVGYVCAHMFQSPDEENPLADVSASPCHVRHYGFQSPDEENPLADEPGQRNVRQRQSCGFSPLTRKTP